MAYGFGLLPKWSIRYGNDGNLVDQVSKVLRLLPETDSSDVVLQLTTFGETALMGCGASACAHSWSHEIFHRINHHEGGMLTIHEGSGTELFLDIPCLMASHGNLTYLRDHFDSQPEQPSSY